MLLQGETDWKVIAIDVTDPLAEQLQDIGDVDRLMPGFLKATVEWFKIYKMPDGKPANEFAFNAEPKNKEFAEKIIAGTHSSWQELTAAFYKIVSQFPGDIKEVFLLYKYPAGDLFIVPFPVPISKGFEEKHYNFIWRKLI